MSNVWYSRVDGEKAFPEASERHHQTELLSQTCAFRTIDKIIKMAPFRTLFLLLTLGAASAFGPNKPITTSPTKSVTSQKPSSELNIVNAEVYEEAQARWAEQFGPLAKWGWGPSVHAEKWNGRHAMFGWFFICCTAYAKGHGLIPDMDVPLNLKTWGTLATITGKGTITKGRAIILIANVHFFAVSLMATICPLPFGDSLLLDPDDESYEKSMARNQQPFGYLPEFKTGLTEEAEIINGRLAMLGLITLIFATAIENKPMLDIVNEWTGSFYF